MSDEKHFVISEKQVHELTKRIALLRVEVESLQEKHLIKCSLRRDVAKCVLLVVAFNCFRGGSDGSAGMEALEGMVVGAFAYVMVRIMSLL